MKMMKKAGFTLVELIVVITILAILGTIAFISLQGNTQEAKNSKVTSDVRSLATAAETALTKQELTLRELVDQDGNGTDVEGLFGDNTTINPNPTTGNYEIGAVAFTALRQNGADFGNEYVAAIAIDEGDSRNSWYQIAGQALQPSGEFQGIIRGNFIDLNPTNPDYVRGLVGTTESSDGFTTGADIGVGGLY